MLRCRIDDRRKWNSWEWSIMKKKFGLMAVNREIKFFMANKKIQLFPMVDKDK
jgi:hypothetical protein